MSTENNETNQAKESFEVFINSKYESFGPTENMVFRTSRELAYECREMCEPSLPDIAQVMTELSFKSDQFCGTYAWVLYEKDVLMY